jgi:hypothetical protein
MPLPTSTRKFLAAAITTAVALIMIVPAFFVERKPISSSDGAVPKAREAYSRTVMNRLVEGNLDDIVEMMIPEQRNLKLREGLEQIHDHIQSADTNNAELVGVMVYDSLGTVQESLTFQLRTPHEWVIVNVFAIDSSGFRKLGGVHAYPLAESLAESNAFRFDRMTILHLLVLGLYVLANLIVLAGIYFAISLPVDAPWLWVAFSLVSFTRIFLNWTTGAIGVQPIFFQLFGGTFLASPPYGPWILSVSIPVGAIAVLFKRRAILKSRARAADALAEESNNSDELWNGNLP